MEKENIELIDEYNKKRLLYNLFKMFILKNEDNNSDLTLQKIIKAYKSNESKFLISTLPNDKNIGINFTDLNVINSQYKNNTMSEEQCMQLLGYFEEEVRNFFKEHNINNTEINENNEDFSDNFVLNSKISNVIEQLEKNLNLFKEIYNKYKTSNQTEKQNYINNINKQYIEINKIIENINIYIYETLNSEQFIKSINKLKENISNEIEEKKKYIKLIQTEIKRFTDQGDEMNLYVNEYKKYCNMIDLIKIKNEK